MQDDRTKSHNETGTESGPSIFHLSGESQACT